MTPRELLHDQLLHHYKRYADFENQLIVVQSQMKGAPVKYIPMANVQYIVSVEPLKPPAQSTGKPARPRFKT